MKKRLAGTAFVLALSLALTACTGDSEPKEKEASPPAPAESVKPKKVEQEFDTAPDSDTVTNSELSKTGQALYSDLKKLVPILQKNAKKDIPDGLSGTFDFTTRAGNKNFVNPLGEFKPKAALAYTYAIEKGTVTFFEVTGPGKTILFYANDEVRKGYFAQIQVPEPQDAEFKESSQALQDALAKYITDNEEFPLLTFEEDKYVLQYEPYGVEDATRIEVPKPAAVLMTNFTRTEESLQFSLLLPETGDLATIDSDAGLTYYSLYELK